MNTNPVGWFEIYVADMARTKAFYEKVLALSFAKMSNSDIEMLVFPASMALSRWRSTRKAICLVCIRAGESVAWLTSALSPLPGI